MFPTRFLNTNSKKYQATKYKNICSLTLWHCCGGHGVTKGVTKLTKREFSPCETYRWRALLVQLGENYQFGQFNTFQTLRILQ